MKTTKVLLEERNQIIQLFQKLATSLQHIDSALEAQVSALRVKCGFDQISASHQLAWLCLELQLQPADRVILLEELLSRQATIEQFLISLQQSPTPSICAALATLPSKDSPSASYRTTEPWKN